MSAEENKAIFRRYVEEIWNQGNDAAIDELVSTNFVTHFPGVPETKSLEGYREFFTLLRAAFPDPHFTVDLVVAEGDKIAARWVMHATHKGAYLGIAPTGKAVSFTSTVVYRIADGKIEESWGDMDSLGLLQQLGATIK
jgi:steroid delta-isomerase-like uncharacterized protein